MNEKEEDVEEWQDEATSYTVPPDPAKVDVEAVHDFLTNHSYWAKGITLESVHKSILHSLPFSLYSPEGGFAGFARVVTDYTCFAYLADVYVHPSHRKKGLSKFIVACILKCEKVRDVRGFLQHTQHSLIFNCFSLYQQFGFTVVNDRCMLSPNASESHPAGHYDPSLITYTT